MSNVTSGGNVTALLSGCSGGKSSPYGVDVTTVNSNETTGQGTITWTDKKTTTFTYSNASGGSFSCPTLLGQSAADKEIVTTTVTGGTAKITENGSSNTCVYVGTDGTVVEQQVGSGTI